MVDTGPAWLVAGNTLEFISIGNSTGWAGSVAGSSMEEEAIFAIITLVVGSTPYTVIWTSNTLGT